MVIVIPVRNPDISTNPNPPVICLGQPATLSASSGTFDGPFDNGGFKTSNPTGWLVDGQTNNLPSRPANLNEGPWGRVPNRKKFGSDWFSSSSSEKAFAIANGQYSSILETPVFSLMGMTSAYLSLLQAIRLIQSGTSAKIEISVDGGAYITLQEYIGPVNVGITDGLTLFNINLALYLGQTNLRIRFNYTGSTGSAWAIDEVKITETPGGLPPSPVTYQWSPPDGLSATSGSTVIATPSETTLYTVTSTISGCTLGSASVQVVVNPLPAITLGSNPSVCRGTTSANLTYSSTANSPDQYSIVWSTTARNAGFTDVINATLPASPIVLAVPGAAPAATYVGTLSVRNSATDCVSGTYPISVTVYPLVTINGTLNICVSLTTQLTGSGLPAATTPWVSGTPSVATVSNTGLVTGISAGTSQITYTDSNGCSTSVTVTVYPLPSTSLIYHR
jgi:hypothetical protein